jgi:hypothetical protein
LKNIGKKGSVPISFKGKELLLSENQYFPILNRIDSFIDVRQVVDFVKSDSGKAKVKLSDHSLTNFIPGKKMEIKVNAENFLKACKYMKGAGLKAPESIKFTINKTYLGRSELLILDILASNNWERPLYFIYPHLVEELGLGEYLHREGMLYRFMPFKQDEIAAFAKERSLHQYNLIMNEFNWGNIQNDKVYLDNSNVQNVNSFRIRQIFIETANLLTVAGEKGKAVEVLDKAQYLLPPNRIPYSWFITEMVKSYQTAGQIEKAIELSNKIEGEMQQRYQFSKGFKGSDRNSYVAQETLYIMQQLAELKN